MTKADIVETIYEKIGFSRKESAEIVDLVFDLMKETLEGERRSRSPVLEISSSARNVPGREGIPKPARRSRSPPAGS